jgi:hypothetical protein
MTMIHGHLPASWPMLHAREPPNKYLLLLQLQ